MSINRVNISGHLTRDPELRMTPKGTQVRFYIVTGLARAGTADNHDIEVSVMFEVELRFFQGKTIIFREEKIVGRIRLILEGDSFFKGAPFRRSGFLSIAIVTGIHECVEPDDENRNGER